MSYNYDYNPWDDNYNANAVPPSNNIVAQQLPVGGYEANQAGDYATSSGYINPTSQYQDPWADQQQQYTTDYNSSYNEGVQQQQLPDTTGAGRSGDGQQHGYGGAGQRPNQQSDSMVGRLLRAHVPGCGACMDFSTQLLDAILKHVNRDLLVSKIFYFFFYSAFGSLFPLMGVYFKQLGMNPAQVGTLTGVRPFIEIFSAPFWNSLADRFQKGKILLLFSLASWIVFTYSLAHIRPPASACVAFNDTDYVLYTPYSANDLSNYDVGQLEESTSGEAVTAANTNEVFMNKMPSPNAEGKDEILVSEENVNDQGRRRRRKRSLFGASQEQIDRPRSRRATDGDVDEGYESHMDLVDIDLENDFEDTPVRQARNSRPWTFFESSDPVDSSAEYRGDGDASELEQQLHRAKRHSDDDENDEVLADSGESAANEDGNKYKTMRLTTRRGGGDSDEGQEGGGHQEESQGGELEEGESETETDYSKKPGKKQQQDHNSIAHHANTENTRESQTTTKETHNEGDSASVNNGHAKTKKVYKQRHKTPPTHIVGMSPITVEYAVNYNREKHSQFVTPMFSTIVYKLDDIKEVFFLLLLLISLGEFFSAPALTIADSLTLSFLGENTDLYGRQRMFGSLGWAMTLLLVGMALDNSTTIADHPCGPHQRERSYTVCFTIFSLLMGCAFLTATQFTFMYPSKSLQSGGVVVTKTTDGTGDAVITTTLDGQTTATVDDLYASTRPREIFNTAPPVNAPPLGQHGTKEKFEFIDKWKSAVFAQSTWKLPEWVNVFRQFRKSMHLTYLFITWFLGCGVGLVFTFLFWHLQDVGGTPTLFGICSVINHISEVLAYFFSSYFIKRFGHTKVLSVGLGCNVIRFLYVAFLSNPYYALPFELVQGITHAACFAACCSYMSHVSKPELKASTQGVMQGLHNGIGRACGALLGGYMINAVGSRASFCIYGLLSGCVLGGLLYIRKKASQEEDEEVKVDENENLGDFGAPQGVPSAIPGKMI